MAAIKKDGKNFEKKFKEYDRWNLTTILGLSNFAFA